MPAARHHSRAARWLHAGLAVAVAVDLTSDIILQAPRGGHPGNLFYTLHEVSDAACLMLALGLWLAGARQRTLLLLVAGMAASGVLANFGGVSAVVGHEVLTALVWVALLGHLLQEMLRHYGRDDGLAEMWSLWRQSR